MKKFIVVCMTVLVLFGCSKDEKYEPLHGSTLVIGGLSVHSYFQHVLNGKGWEGREVFVVLKDGDDLRDVYRNGRVVFRLPAGYESDDLKIILPPRF